MKIIKDGYLRVPITKETLNIAQKHYSYIKSGNLEPVFSAQISEDRSTIQFPRNTKRIKKYITEEVKIVDRRIEYKSEKLKLSDTFKLRKYQVQPVLSVIQTIKNDEDNACILQALPSFGKSYVLPKIVSELNQATLIIIDRTLLVDQMYQEFKQNVVNNNLIAKLTKTNYTKNKSVYITTFQFLLKNKEIVEYLKEKIGFIVIDEAHTIGSEVFTKVMAQFPAKYRLGLSATPTRSDGLTQILTDTFADNIIIGHNPTNLTIDVIGVKCKYRAEWVGNGYADVATHNLTQPFLTEAVKLTLKVSKLNNRICMLYANYKGIRTHFYNVLTEEGYKCAIIDGKTKKEERNEIIEKLQKNELDILITGVIIQKGVSIHSLDTIINLGHHNKESLEQLWGRLRREHSEKKKPLFIDFFLGGVLSNQANDRYALSKRLAKKSNDSFKVMDYDKYISIIKTKLS